MKRQKDGKRILTGQILEGTYSGSENRIQLFDGKFTTGYRIVSFKICPEEPTVSNNVIAKISTEPKSTITKWHWNDVQEVAWVHWSSMHRGIETSLNLREDNMAIEDLWISAYSAEVDQALINYEIVLEKYSFASWDGAGILVENLSQAGPQ